MGDPRAILETKKCIHDLGLNTVCEQAKCPNLQVCFGKKRATFLLLGNFCTRACSFCAVEHSSQPLPPDPNEPEIVAEACENLRLKHVVLTMVTRDDLADGGACHVAQTIRAVKKKLPEATCEALVSDFQGDEDALRVVLDADPDIFSHNVETVPRLTPRTRSKATFERSLNVLHRVKKLRPSQMIKSGLMVGLGETFDEVIEVLRLLAAVPTENVTIGQYLQPTPRHLAVSSFVPPEIFEAYEQEAKRLGIAKVSSGPFVRSSFAG